MSYKLFSIFCNMENKDENIIYRKETTYKF